MMDRIRKPLLLLGVAILALGGCASDKINTDYLKARAEPTLKVPAGMQLPAPTGHEAPVDNLSAQELKALRPQQLFTPPEIVTATTPADSTQPAARGPSLAKLRTDANGADFLQISLRYDEAWSRIRLGLMGSGFTITDINRSNGQFYIRYRDPSAGQGSPDHYVLNLLDVGGGSRLLVRDQDGKILSGDVARHILKLVSEIL